MNAIVVDSEALTAWADSDPDVLAFLEAVQRHGGTAVVPTVVLAESLTGHGSRDAKTNRRLHSAVADPCPEDVARRAAALRHGARMSGAQTVDAIVVATAEDTASKTVLTGDPSDLTQLAVHASGVAVLDYRDI